jgi:hypothetical protein
MTAPGSYRRKKGLWIFPPVVAVSTMLGALLAAGALGVAAVRVAAPASAVPSYCYTDVYGHCTAIRYPDGSAADMGAWGHTSDEHFAYLLTHNDDPRHNIVIMDIPTVKAQGLRACQQETNGMDHVTVRDQLAASGGYAWEQANNITSAADTIYCPWNGPPEASPAPPPPPPGL